jgi:hypothetical protein
VCAKHPSRAVAIDFLTSFRILAANSWNKIS